MIYLCVSVGSWAQLVVTFFKKFTLSWDLFFFCVCVWLCVQFCNILSAICHFIMNRTGYGFAMIMYFSFKIFRNVIHKNFIRCIKTCNCNHYFRTGFYKCSMLCCILARKNLNPKKLNLFNIGVILVLFVRFFNEQLSFLGKTI